jgi:hypothetical protein
MRDGQERTGKRGDPFRTTDGSTTGRERDREHGRTGMKFRLNRQLVSVVTTVALLLAVVATVALFRGRAPSAVPAAPSSGAAASQGDYRLSPPNEAEPSGAGVGVTFPAGNEPALTDFREDHRADAPAVPVDHGAGPSEFLPGETGVSPLPSATPDASEDPGPACRLLAGCDR